MSYQPRWRCLRTINLSEAVENRAPLSQAQKRATQFAATLLEKGRFTSSYTTQLKEKNVNKCQRSVKQKSIYTYIYGMLWIILVLGSIIQRACMRLQRDRHIMRSFHANPTDCPSPIHPTNQLEYSRTWFCLLSACLERSSTQLDSRPSNWTE